MNNTPESPERTNWALVGVGLAFMAVVCCFMMAGGNFDAIQIAGGALMFIIGLGCCLAGTPNQDKAKEK